MQSATVLQHYSQGFIEPGPTHKSDQHAQAKNPNPVVTKKAGHLPCFGSRAQEPAMNDTSRSPLVYKPVNMKPISVEPIALKTRSY